MACLGVSGAPSTPKQSEAQEMRPVFSIKTFYVGRVAGSTGGWEWTPEQPGQGYCEHVWAGQLACTVSSVTDVPASN